jgi:hypothetical protein
MFTMLHQIPRRPPFRPENDDRQPQPLHHPGPNTTTDTRISQTSTDKRNNDLTNILTDPRQVPLEPQLIHQNTSIERTTATDHTYSLISFQRKNMNTCPPRNCEANQHLRSKLAIFNEHYNNTVWRLELKHPTYNPHKQDRILQLYRHLFNDPKAHCICCQCSNNCQPCYTISVINHHEYLNQLLQTVDILKQRNLKVNHHQLLKETRNNKKPEPNNDPLPTKSLPGKQETSTHHLHPTALLPDEPHTDNTCLPKSANPDISPLQLLPTETTKEMQMLSLHK